MQAKNLKKKASDVATLKGAVRSELHPVKDTLNGIKKLFTQLNTTIQRIERNMRARTPPNEPKAAGFLKGDRRMLRQIHRATVFCETPSAAMVAGDVRRQQVLYGVKLYKPPRKYDDGCSSYRAAEKAIRAPQFSGVEGAYSPAEKKTLAKAIVREYKSPRADLAT